MNADGRAPSVTCDERRRGKAAVAIARGFAALIAEAAESRAAMQAAARAWGAVGKAIEAEAAVRADAAGEKA